MDLYLTHEKLKFIYKDIMKVQILNFDLLKLLPWMFNCNEKNATNCVSGIILADLVPNIPHRTLYCIHGHWHGIAYMQWPLVTLMIPI